MYLKKKKTYAVTIDKIHYEYVVNVLAGYNGYID